MPFYQRGSTRIYYEEVGSGFPLLNRPCCLSGEETSSKRQDHAWCRPDAHYRRRGPKLWI